MIGPLAGDLIGSTFEGAWFEGKSFQTCVCAGCSPKRQSPRLGARSSDFELFFPGSAITDDSILTIALMEWLLAGPLRRLERLAELLRSYYPALPRRGVWQGLSKVGHWGSPRAVQHR